MTRRQMFGMMYPHDRRREHHVHIYDDSERRIRRLAAAQLYVPRRRRIHLLRRLHRWASGLRRAGAYGEHSAMLERQRPAPRHPSRAAAAVAAAAAGRPYEPLVSGTGLMPRLTQADVARIMGVSTVTVNRWRNGHSQPSAFQAEVLRRIDNTPQRSASVRLAEFGPVDALAYCLDAGRGGN